MNDIIDMSTPVIRGELREELTQLEERIDRKVDQLEIKFDTKIDQLEHKFDAKIDQLEQKFVYKLGEMGNWLWDLMEKRFAESDRRAERTHALIVEMDRRLSRELTRHTQAAYEAIPTQIAAVDEKYQDLPGRTTRLEIEVEGLTAEVNALK